MKPLFDSPTKKEIEKTKKKRKEIYFEFKRSSEAWKQGVANRALRFLNIERVAWLLCGSHWNNLINGAEWVGGCGRSADKSKTLMKTEGKAQLGEELGSIAVYRTLLAASNLHNAYVQGKMHYKLSAIFMIILFT